MAAEPETGLVTDTDLTAGNVGDAEAAPGLIADEPAGTEVLGDSAYGAGDFRDHLQENSMKAFIKPGPLRAAVEGGYTIDDFEIDEENGTLTCPAGIKVKFSPTRTASFAKSCQGCLLRYRCTTSTKGRVIKLHPNHALLAAARVFAGTDEFDDVYRNYRPMVERTIAWLVRGSNRKLRYRGIDKNRWWLSTRAAAVNLKRMLNLGLAHDGTRWVMLVK